MTGPTQFCLWVWGFSPQPLLPSEPAVLIRLSTVPPAGPVSTRMGAWEVGRPARGPGVVPHPHGRSRVTGCGWTPKGGRPMPLGNGGRERTTPVVFRPGVSPFGEGRRSGREPVQTMYPVDSDDTDQPYLPGPRSL